jgi:hypothetical protein
MCFLFKSHNLKIDYIQAQEEILSFCTFQIHWVFSEMGQN